MVAGNDVVLTTGAALMVRVNVFVANAFRLSVTRSVKLNGPVAVGVPLNVPDALMVSQIGSVAPLSLKTSVPVPPTAAMGCE